MNAEDTVMNRIQVNKLWQRIDLGSLIPAFANYGEGHPTYELLKAQAEITWDKCREQTAREIFEGAEQAMAGLDANKPELYQYQSFNVIPTKHWQSLKSEYLPKEEK